MSDAGYIYALINASMPGLVKVGRTTRNPKDRASELSGVTGVATPFMVVYQEHFIDCEEAETWIHETLQQQGFRVAPNREFFNAEIVDVIKSIALCPNKCRSDSVDINESFLDLLSDTDDELSEMNIKMLYPAEQLYLEAEELYYGFDDSLQDYKEALVLYKQAARLGSIDAYLRIGNIYAHGEGVRKDITIALDFYKEGARKGMYIWQSIRRGINLDIIPEVIVV